MIEVKKRHTHFKPQTNYYNIVRNVLKGISTEKIVALVFIGVDESKDYLSILTHLTHAVYQVIGKEIPITLVPQYVLPQGGLTVEIYLANNESQVKICKKEGISLGIIENNDYRMLWTSGILPSDATASMSLQSNEIFGKLESVLHSENYKLSDIVRQWNYIGNITGFRNSKQNYQEFNDIRSKFYAKVIWENGYPAATGIGASFEGLVISCIAFQRNNNRMKSVLPIDNPLQTAAPIYSNEVLISNHLDNIRSTPKFERAKMIITHKKGCLFLSGTAAIRGEKSMNKLSAKLQTQQTVENIQYLLSENNLCTSGCPNIPLKLQQLRVYIKNKEDYAVVWSIMEATYPLMPVTYTVADVCRDELLVEVEAILTI